MTRVKENPDIESEASRDTTAAHSFYIYRTIVPRPAGLHPGD